MRSAGVLGTLAPAQWQAVPVVFALGMLILPERARPRLANPLLTETLAHIGHVLDSTVVLVGLQAVLWVVGAPLLPWSLLVPALLLHLTLGAALRVLVSKLAGLSQPRVRVVVVGADTHGRALAQYLRARDGATEVVGFVDDRLARTDAAVLTASFLGSTRQFANRPVGWDAVVIAIPAAATDRIRALADTLRNGQTNVYLAPALPLLQSGHLHLAGGEGSLQDLALLGMHRLPLLGRAAKRLFDVVFSATALLLFLPCGLLIAALIKLESPGPVFFCQRRYGRGHRLFDLYKFRTMRFNPQGAADGEIRLTQRGDARVTRIGDFLRRTSLDEFPQFMNVLLGQMSVVGPRPHPPGVKVGERTYEDVVAGFMERYKVRPGITGWAQVNGLRGSTFTEDHLTRRFASDVEYIRNWSFEFDLWIVLKTVAGGFGGKNAF
ncbi:MAG TPA: exopolysaccharide biosynthesis polyprenyl glycosylphosphotransferase [Ramlibacter sp.]|nr:exopolysaccharide biosynthesis polyprenyl glycosylphosphotransferase [Ramlibacter sp.]